MCCMVRRVVHFMIVNCLLNRHQWTTQNRQDRVIIFIETNKMVIKLHIWTMCPFSPLFIIWRNACQYLRLIKILSAVVYFFFSLTLARDCIPHTHREEKKGYKKSWTSCWRYTKYSQRNLYPEILQIKTFVVVHKIRTA